MKIEMGLSLFVFECISMSPLFTSCYSLLNLMFIEIIRIKSVI